VAFNGFTQGSLDFLKSLVENNNRDWFLEHKKVYEAELLEPAKQFVESIAAGLFEISSDLRAEPRVNGSISRINRDTRFSKDKTPYKGHMGFHFAQGSGKDRPGYFLRFTPDNLGLGAGIYSFDKDLLSKYREAVASDNRGQALAATVDEVKEAGHHVGGERFKRVPRGYNPNHPRANLLRHGGLYAYTELAIPGEFFSRSFPFFCATRFEKLSPLMNWLVGLVDG
jgi:uncharacterized protein (TIGR02453 family)